MPPARARPVAVVGEAPAAVAASERDRSAAIQRTAGPRRPQVREENGGGSRQGHVASAMELSLFHDPVFALVPSASRTTGVGLFGWWRKACLSGKALTQ